LYKQQLKPNLKHHVRTNEHLKIEIPKHIKSMEQSLVRKANISPASEELF